MATQSASSTVSYAGRAAMAGLLLVSIGVAALATLEINADFMSGHEWAPLVAFTSVAWLVCYAVCSWAYFGSPYLFSNAYVMVLAVFHLGLLLPYAMGTVDVLEWRGGQGRWIALAAWYTALAFAAFGIGFAIYCLQEPVRQVPLKTERDLARFILNLARLRNLATGLIIASALALVIVILRLGNVLAYSRFALFFQSGDPRFLSLFFFLAPTAALALVTTARTRSQKAASYLFGAFIVLLALLSGNRSWALFPMLAGTVVWVKLGRRIPLFVALSAVAGILLLIPMIAMIRSLGTYEQLSLKDFESSRQRSSITGALLEMGSTVNALAVTVKYIPDKEPYRFGLPFYMYLKQAVPNLGLGASRESSRDTLYQRLLSDSSAVLELEPSDWAAWKIIPESFVAGAGTGFSGIAEPYFSFGYWGVLVWFILLGAFLAKMDLVDIRLNYKWLIFGALFYWHLLVTCRNSFGVFTKPSALTLLVLAIWIVVRNFTPFRRPYQPPIPM